MKVTDFLNGKPFEVGSVPRVNYSLSIYMQIFLDVEVRITEKLRHWKKLVYFHNTQKLKKINCCMYNVQPGLKKYGCLDLMSAYFYSDHTFNVHIALWNETCSGMGINYQICTNTHTHTQLYVHTKLFFVFVYKAVVLGR